MIFSLTSGQNTMNRMIISLVTSSILLNSVLDNSYFTAAIACEYNTISKRSSHPFIFLSGSTLAPKLIITYCLATSMNLQKGSWPSHWHTSFGMGVSPSCTVGRAACWTASVSPIVRMGTTSGSMVSYVQPLCVLMYCTLLEYVYIYLIIVGWYKWRVVLTVLVSF